MHAHHQDRAHAHRGEAEHADAVDPVDRPVDHGHLEAAHFFHHQAGVDHREAVKVTAAQLIHLATLLVGPAIRYITLTLINKISRKFPAFFFDLHLSSFVVAAIPQNPAKSHIDLFRLIDSIGWIKFRQLKSEAICCA